MLIKYFLSLTLTIIIFNSCNPSSTEQADTGEVVFDEALAQKYGADDYGMKQYVMAFLKSGPNRNQSKEEAEIIQKGHMANMTVMAEEGKLVLAGPFMDDFEIKGIYIFNTTSIEEAAEWTATDPAIQAGRLEMELHPWYGSAALMEINNLHLIISKNPI